MGASPAGGAGGAGGVPLVPGVVPVLAGIEDPGEVGGALVGSCCPTELVTVVVMVAGAAGRSGSGTDGILGRAGLLATWRCSDGWCACCWPAGVPDEVALGDLAELALGDDGVPDGLALCPPLMRFDKVGFTACWLVGELGVVGALGDSGVGVVVARGISGSFCGSGTGA